jgi:C-terminal processing protease CtpA/Prc
MHTPHIAGPFGRFAGWKGYSWHLEPASPRIGGKVVFLTDARAVSASESVLGYVDALRLGTIVGGPTAGANGNAITFNVPSGMTVTFTGMRVTGHDGSPFHLSGVRPAVPVEPTLAGIRAGRDEVLERALSILGR